MGWGANSWDLMHIRILDGSIIRRPGIYEEGEASGVEEII